MKIFSINDESNPFKENLGYLLYYPQSRVFIIELREDIPVRYFPLFLEHFARNKQYTIDSRWSEKWVEQRIIPRDRQNLGAILRDNHLKDYDPFRLLQLSRGRGAQDDCAVMPVSISDIPDWLNQRLKEKIKTVIPLPDYRPVAASYDDSVRIAKIKDLITDVPQLLHLRNTPELYHNATVEAGGNRICWGTNISVSLPVLQRFPKLSDFSWQDIKHVISFQVIDTTEACRILDCSRQYIHQLEKKGALSTITPHSKNHMFI